MPNRLMQFFKFDHLPSNLKEVSAHCCELAKMLDSLLPESAEKMAGLRKLLEAKDCFVRALLEKSDVSDVAAAAEKGFKDGDRR